MQLVFDAGRFVAEYRSLGGQLVLADQPGGESSEWFGIIHPGPAATSDMRARAKMMRQELVSVTAHESLVVEVLRRERAEATFA